MAQTDQMLELLGFIIMVGEQASVSANSLVVRARPLQSRRTRATTEVDQKQRQSRLQRTELQLKIKPSLAVLVFELSPTSSVSSSREQKHLLSFRFLAFPGRRWLFRKRFFLDCLRARTSMPTGCATPGRVANATYGASGRRRR